MLHAVKKIEENYDDEISDVGDDTFAAMCRETSISCMKPSKLDLSKQGIINKTKSRISLSNPESPEFASTPNNSTSQSHRNKNEFTTAKKLLETSEIQSAPAASDDKSEIESAAPASDDKSEIESAPAASDDKIEIQPAPAANDKRETSDSDDKEESPSSAQHLLSSWGLPECVVDSYSDRGIRAMFPWQVMMIMRVIMIMTIFS